MPPNETKARGCPSILLNVPSFSREGSTLQADSTNIICSKLLVIAVGSKITSERINGLPYSIFQVVNASQKPPYTLFSFIRKYFQPSTETFLTFSRTQYQNFLKTFFTNVFDI